MPEFFAIPKPFAQALRLLPNPPLSLMLTQLTRGILRRHPGIVSRLGDQAGKSFALAPTDLPLVLVLSLPGGVAKVKVQRDGKGADCMISGKLSALLGLVHGAVDGDALFFSRDLVIEGDTEAALALRNAVDDAELDLAEEITRLAPPLAPMLKRLVAAAERRTGVALHRAGGVL
ncbi:ubiquinone anaerobic biosynthesis accessory factor UbiT [Rhodobacter ferrooxidans]|uniref:Sterol-binding domain protein n=1 Tax=Rhodobacter ferrooxidans TaxID=371731 RepID=C8RX36_9RHOB|nr:SCP2 sterol-binding domain-containing protein [Rhodobacter sp. SW2]EEW26561.1 Sterol-binding domain protein [Rhodobacter sp. SW2]